MLSHEKTQETPMYTIFLNIHGSEKQRYAAGQHLRDLYKKDMNLKRHRREGSRSGGPVSRRWTPPTEVEGEGRQTLRSKGCKVLSHEKTKK